jgi:hypothetical protein
LKARSPTRCSTGFGASQDFEETLIQMQAGFPDFCMEGTSSGIETNFLIQ